MTVVTVRLHYADGDVIEVEPPSYREVRDSRLAEYKEGDRFRLVALAQTVIDGVPGFDDLPNLPPGTCGTVECPFEVADALGSLFVRWDNGSRLNAAASDVIEKI